MSAIRPGLPQPVPSQGLDLPTARNAQAAFFRAALDQASRVQPSQAPAAAVMSTVRTANPARPVEPAPVAPEREEPRIMRPGSYLDIKV
ncbi:MAG: hypothetical protein JHC96_17620 [Brevundimonas sp.]|jgi:hypothetical protein|uniref:hypothetical protein n=1 Tax=unclassified Brevundimonas TaxID=2622653 RepID=UPI001A2401B0|nr:hypothetical protein [Brevundimonas sp.]MBJ7320603.1 hypothetical protein [Brevundimonas sp.]